MTPKNMDLNFDSYAAWAKTTGNMDLTSKAHLTNAAMGLAGEAGEVVDHVKKHLFQGHDLDEAKVINELGDILWYIARMADVLDTNLSVVAALNMDKLNKRYPDGFSAEASKNR